MLPQAGENLYKQFESDTKNLYGTISISDKILKSATGADAGSFINALQRDVDTLVKTLKWSTARQIYGDGSGILVNEDTEALTVPEGVEVTELLVDYGDTVTEGDLLAIVDTATVRTVMADVQAQIEDLDKQIRKAESDRVSSDVRAGVAGRVKVIYAQVGDSVASVMVEHGALALVSLDGHLAVKVETNTLTVGDSVTVYREDGTALAGQVSALVGETATVLVTDNGPLVDESVRVCMTDGTEVGSGKLQINSPLAVTGYAGTVRSVAVRENAQVYASTRVFSLTDTTHSANYDALLRQREEVEKTLLELLKLQKYGGLTATVSGSVLTVADLDSETGYTELVTLSPDREMSVTISVDEGDILALELQQKADVTVRSVGEEALVGTVTEIDKTAADGSYTAVITLNKIPGMLQGMSADVNVKIQGVDNAQLIPVDALHETAGGAYVFTAYDEETQQYGGRVDVTTGLRNDDYVEITSGLKTGDTVYYTEAQRGFNFFDAMGGNRGNSGGQRPGGSSGGQIPGGSGGYPSGGQMPGSFPGGQG